MSEMILMFDGLVEPRNPGGTLCWGYVLKRDGVVVNADSGGEPARPQNTNNIAEYYGLGHGLRFLQRLMPLDGHLLVLGDSMLVVKQVMGEWRCNQPRLALLRDRCRELLASLKIPWEARHIPREQNEEADRLTQERYEYMTGRKVPVRKKAI